MSFCDVSCSFLSSVIWKTRVPGKHCYQFPAYLTSLDKKELTYILNYFSRCEIHLLLPREAHCEFPPLACLSRKVNWTQKWCCRFGWKQFLCRSSPASVLFWVYAHSSSATGRLAGRLGCSQGLLMVRRVEETLQCLSWDRTSEARWS